MNVDSFINFLAACQLVHSADHVAKNYLVHADPSGKFAFYPWDMDLTHGRNFECDGGGVWNDTIRHDLWDREHGDEALLFGTRFNPKCDQGPNAVIDAFLVKTRAFRPDYYRRIAQHLTHYYHPEVLIPKIERDCNRIRKEVAKDRRIWSSYGGDDDFERQEEILTAWVRTRFEYLREKLEALGYPLGEPLNAEFEASPRSGAAPLRVSFENLSVGEITGCEWSFGDGATASARTPVHVYGKPGRYDVTLEVAGPRDEHSTTRRALIFVPDAGP
jgi:hypothetical protein